MKDYLPVIILLGIIVSVLLLCVIFLVLLIKVKRRQNIKSTIIWRYSYVERSFEEATNNILPDDTINETPDEHNRWAIEGYLRIKTSALPIYKWAGREINIPFCRVKYICSNLDNTHITIPLTNWRFRCTAPTLSDANFGYSNKCIQAITPREVMIEVQKEFDQLIKCLTNITK